MDFCASRVVSLFNEFHNVFAFGDRRALVFPVLRDVDILSPASSEPLKRASSQQDGRLVAADQSVEALVHGLQCGLGGGKCPSYSQSRRPAPTDCVLAERPGNEEYVWTCNGRPGDCGMSSTVRLSSRTRILSKLLFPRLALLCPSSVAHQVILHTGGYFAHVPAPTVQAFFVFSLCPAGSPVLIARRSRGYRLQNMTASTSSLLARAGSGRRQELS